MKKLLATLITLSFVGSAFAATTYTESVVNKISDSYFFIKNNSR